MKRYAVLNNLEHKDLRVITDRSEKYGDNVSFAMTYPLEFRNLQAYYPICFRKDQDKGIILKDWLYDLYTTDYTNQFDDELLNWIYEIYNLENKNQYFIQRLWNMNLDLTKQLNLTKEEIVKLQLQNQTLNNHLEIIRNNKIYRLIDKIIKFFYVRRF